MNINKKYYKEMDLTCEKVQKELEEGLLLLNNINNKIVTFFGSHRAAVNSEHYLECKRTAFELGRRGYTILSGGGPGIMHAANSGATESKTESVGLLAGLLTEEKITDPIFTQTVSFNFLFVRRFILSIKSEALVFYPGGYGTLNELFEYAVLMQLGIVDTVPIICVNRDYWKGLFEWLQTNPLKNDFFISDVKDLNLLYFVDSVSEILEIIKLQGSSFNN